jgi:hypothetical protein
VTITVDMRGYAQITYFAQEHGYQFITFDEMASPGESGGVPPRHRLLGKGRARDGAFREYSQRSRDILHYDHLRILEPVFAARPGIDQFQFHQPGKEMNMVQPLGSTLLGHPVEFPQDGRQLQRLEVMSQKKFGLASF